MTIKKYYKKILLTLSFSIPIILLCGLFIYNTITPFGDNSLLLIDMDGQYISFFSYYKELIAGRADWLYSFSKSFGGGMQGLIAYYLMSPLNLILCFFSTENLATAMSVLAFLKIGFCGLTSFIFFSNISEYKIPNLIFSTFYALMGYNLAFISTPMWLDAVIILPIVILGIERILSHKGALVYILALSYAIITNYYIGFMVCIFSGLFFLYRWITAPKLQPLLNFTGASLLSGGLGAFVFVPAFASLQGTPKAVLGLDSLISLEPMFRMRDFINGLLFPAPFTMENHTNGLPNVYVGCAVLILIAIYFISKKFSVKEKLLSFAFASFMVLSFYFKGLFLIWHGFDNPVWFWHRNSFLFSFLLLYIAFLGFSALNKTMVTRFAFYTLSAINLIAVMVNAQSVIAFNGSGTTVDFKQFLKDVTPIVQEIKSSDNSLYRLEKTFSHNSNDAMLLNYNSLTHFSSGEKMTTRKITLRAGYDTVEQYSSYLDGSTISNDSLFGIKYLLSRYHLTGDLNLREQKNGIYIYENPYALPISFEASNGITEFEFQDLTPANFANEFSSAIMDTPLQLETVENISSEQLYNTEKSALKNSQYTFTPNGKDPLVEYTFYSPKSGSAWFYCFSDQFPQNVSIKINDKKAFSYFTVANRGNVYIGEFLEGEKITVSLSFKDPTLLCAYPQLIFTNPQNLANFSQGINKLDLTTFDTHKFSGTINIQKDNSGLLVTIPYETGWHAYVDGKRQPIAAAAQSFVYLPLEKGEHTIELKFVPDGMAAGFAITFISLVVFAYTPVKKRFFFANSSTAPTKDNS